MDDQNDTRRQGVEFGEFEDTMDSLFYRDYRRESSISRRESCGAFESGRVE